MWPIAIIVVIAFVVGCSRKDGVTKEKLTSKSYQPHNISFPTFQPIIPVSARPKMRYTYHYKFWEWLLGSPLFNRQDFEAYRIMYEHSFGGVLGAVEIKSETNNKTIFVWKKSPNSADNSTEVKSVSEKEWGEFMTLIAKSNFWVANMNQDLKEIAGMLDGGTCTIEGVKNFQYHAVMRNDLAKNIMDVCLWAVGKSRFNATN